MLCFKNEGIFSSQNIDSSSANRRLESVGAQNLVSDYCARQGGHL